MKQIKLEESTRLADVLSQIQNSPETEIEIISTGSSLFDLPLNRKLLTRASEKFGKKVRIKDKNLATESQSQEAQSENLGFVEGQDVAAATEADEQPVPAEQLKEEPREEPKVMVGKKKRNFLAKFSLLRRSKKFYAILGAVLLIIFLGVVGIFFLPSAQVTVFTSPQFQEAEFSLTASEAASEVDKDGGVIPLKTLDTTQDDSLEAQATGSKTVGEPAKGRVKIVNRDSSNAKTFFKGAVITPTTGTKIAFVIAETVNLPKADVGCEGDCPEAGVDVTASTIGTEGNLKSGTVFKVGNADVNLVFAKNETNFSGGTSQKVKVISADDQKKLKEDLLKNLEEKAKRELEQGENGVEVPDGGLKSEVLEETYSNQVGEETENFRLSMQVRFTAKTFSEDDLKQLLLDQMKEKVPVDFELDEENISVSSEILDQGDQELKVLGKIKAALIPSLNQDEVKRNIAGKDFGSVDSYLRSLNSVAGFDVKVSPLPFRIFGILPFVQSRISIQVEQEQ